MLGVSKFDFGDCWRSDCAMLLLVENFQCTLKTVVAAVPHLQHLLHSVEDASREDQSVTANISENHLYILYLFSPRECLLGT